MAKSLAEHLQSFRDKFEEYLSGENKSGEAPLEGDVIVPRKEVNNCQITR